MERSKNRSDKQEGRDEARGVPGLRKFVLVVGGAALLFGGCLFGGIKLGFIDAEPVTAYAVTEGNLRQIGTAILRHQDEHGDLPGNTYAPDDTPLLSWRVHILPQLGHADLYRQFKLNEPWDGPTNRPLIDRIPDVYVQPRTRLGTPRGSTHYRGFSSTGAVFGRRLVVGRDRPDYMKLTTADFRDGAAKVVMVIEAAERVEWTRPADLEAVRGQPFPRVITYSFDKQDMFAVVYANGEAGWVSTHHSAAAARALVTYAGENRRPDD